MPNDLGKKYSLWRNSLIFGMCIWPLAGAFVLIGNGLVGAGGGNAARIANFLQPYYVAAVVFAGILAPLMLYFATLLVKEGKTKQAITVLQIPFLYLLLLVVFYFSVEVFK